MSKVERMAKVIKDDLSDIGSNHLTVKNLTLDVLQALNLEKLSCREVVFILVTVLVSENWGKVTDEEMNLIKRVLNRVFEAKDLGKFTVEGDFEKLTVEKIKSLIEEMK
jgi:hypothetical protein